MINKFLAICLKVILSIQRRIKNRLLHMCSDSNNSVMFNITSKIISNDKHRISIGNNTIMLGTLLLFEDKGYIKIGDECYVGENAQIWSGCGIDIGNRVMISYGVNIHDTISHSLSATERNKQFKTIFLNKKSHNNILDIKSLPIYIKDDVWIGFNATILKGVTIGKGAIIASNAIVTKDVDAYSVVAGPTANVIAESFK